MDSIARIFIHCLKAEQRFCPIQQIQNIQKDHRSTGKMSQYQKSAEKLKDLKHSIYTKQLGI